MTARVRHILATKSDANFEAIPSELRQQPNWVLWRYEERAGKRTKIPIDARTGRNASVADPETWVSFADAAARQNGHAGLGFVFDGNGICGIDLDKCRDAKTGVVEPWALEIIRELNSYSEISPSGTGVHILLRGKIPASGRRKDGIEVYDTGRFFCVTGNHLDGTPEMVKERKAEVAALHAQMFSDRDQVPEISASAEKSGSATDSPVVNWARARLIGKLCQDADFAELWRGNWENRYPSQSEADLALCSFLARRVAAKPAVVDGLFRLSGLMRGKWDERRGERSYGEITLSAALADRSEGAATADREGWTLLDASEALTWPIQPTAWHVEGLIPRGGIGFLAGPPKERKSLLALDLSVHLATAGQSPRNWLGKFRCTPCRILYIAREDPPARLRERLLDILQSYGLPALPSGSLCFLSRARLSLMTEEDVAWIANAVHAGKFDLLVLDVFARMLQGLDEQSASDMARAIDKLEELNRELRVTVLVVDHTRKPQGDKRGRFVQEPNPFDLKGSVAKYGACDFIICLSRTTQNGRLQVFAENKDCDQQHSFFIDVSPQNSKKAKFSWAGDVQRLADDAKIVGRQNQRRILESVGSDWMSRAEIEHITGFSRSTTGSHLSRLVASGMLESNDDSRNAKYRKPADVPAEQPTETNLPSRQARKTPCTGA